MKKKSLIIYGTIWLFLICAIVGMIVIPSVLAKPNDENNNPKPEIQYTNTFVSSFQELESAFANTIDNDIIVLTADMDLKEVNDNKALKIESGKNILDLNGFTIKGVDNSTARNWHAIDLRGATTELTIMDSSEEKTGKIEGRCYGIQVSRGAKLTINGGNFVCTTNGTFNQNVVVYGGTLVVNGGVFTSKVGEVINSSSYTWDSVDYHSSVTINGGVFNSIATTESASSLLVFERSEYTSITDIQTVTINGGTFNNNKLDFVVKYDSYVDFTNNGGISEELIDIWEVE